MITITLNGNQIAIDENGNVAGGGDVIVSKIQVTAEQLYSLHTTPIELISAPGENKFINVISQVIYLPAYIGGNFATGILGSVYNNPSTNNDDVYIPFSSISLAGFSAGLLSLRGIVPNDENSEWALSNLINLPLSLRAFQTFTGARENGITVITTYSIVDFN